MGMADGLGKNSFETFQTLILKAHLDKHNTDSNTYMKSSHVSYAIGILSSSLTVPSLSWGWSRGKHPKEFGEFRQLLGHVLGG